MTAVSNIHSILHIANPSRCYVSSIRKYFMKREEREEGWRCIRGYSGET
jgi:hypothetical protein